MITAPGSIGRFFTYTTHSGAAPKVIVQCLPPEDSKPVSCS
jgi:hypothetical protein